MTRAGDRNTQSHGGGRVVTGNPPNMASLLGVGEKPDLFLLSSVFQGRGAVKWGGQRHQIWEELPGWLGFGGRGGRRRLGRKWSSVQCQTQVAGEGR